MSISAVQSVTISKEHPKEIEMLWLRNGRLGQRWVLPDARRSFEKVLYNNSNDVYRFFQSAFNLCGVDGKGTVPAFFISEQDNHLWWSCNSTSKVDNGRAMRYEAIEEMVAHHYTHGILQHFGYRSHDVEAIALSEAVADVFAIGVRHWLAEDRSGKLSGWRIGHRNLNCDVKIGKPGEVTTIWKLSLVASHAFYRATQEYRGAAYGGVAQVWFRAIKKMGNQPSFRKFSMETVEQAKALETTVADVKARGRLTSAIVRSWVDVGVCVQFSLQRSLVPVSNGDPKERKTDRFIKA